MKIYYIVSVFLTTGSLLTSVASIQAEVEVIQNLIPLNPVPAAPLVEPEKIEVNVAPVVPAVEPVIPAVETIIPAVETVVPAASAEVEVIQNLIPLNPVPAAPLVEPEKIEVNIVPVVPVINYREYEGGSLTMNKREKVYMQAKKLIMDDEKRFAEDITPFENFHIQAGELLGKGIIKASNIKIVADTFSFKGLLSYTGKCTIITPIPVDKSQFFIDDINNQPVFIVDPNLVPYKGINFIHLESNGAMSMRSKGE